MMFLLYLPYRTMSKFLVEEVEVVEAKVAVAVAKVVEAKVVVEAVKLVILID